MGIVSTLYRKGTSSFATVQVNLEMVQDVILKGALSFELIFFYLEMSYLKPPDHAVSI